MPRTGERHAMHKDFITQFFRYEHLDAAKAEVSKRFHDLNKWLTENVPSNPERTVAQRKLMEAKDAAVRASFGDFS